MPKERNDRGPRQAKPPKPEPSPKPFQGPATLAAWSEHCLFVTMPSQMSGSKKRYSEDTLEDLRDVIRKNVVPKIGEVRVEDLDKATVTSLISGLKSEDAQAKTLYVLTRVMELAETRGQRKKGTNPCKGVSLSKIRGEGQSPTHPQASPARPENWRDQSE